MFTTDIGVDLGTANVLVYLKGKGVVLQEPSVVTINRDNGEIVAVGYEARKMLGRTPSNIEVIRPLQEGVIADYNMTEKMLRFFLHKVGIKKLVSRPRIMICIPSEITGVEERAVRQAAIQAGAKAAYVVEEPLAAALGAGLDISEPSGNMVVDIGGGTTDVAVLSLGGIVVNRSLRVGGDKFDDAIVRYVRREFNLAIGESSAEAIKIEIGTAFPQATAEQSYEVRGRDLISGLPRSIVITSSQVHEAIVEPLEAMVGAVKEVLEYTLPELAADIINKGIILTGGGALLQGIDALLSHETKLPVYVAEDPLACVALGTGRALEMMDVLAKSNVAAKYVKDRRSK